MSMFRAVAAFELRYQLKSPVFWVTGLVFALLTFGAVASDNIRIGSGGNVWRNSPYAIAQTCMIMSVFAIFIMTAFVANVVVRDDETAFGPIINSTRVSKFDYLFGRFTGAFAAGCLAFLSVPIGMMIGAAMPWVDPETLGPFRLGDYAYVYFALCLPTLFVTGAGFFALATATRSMVSTYVGVIVFLVVYLVASSYFDKPEFAATAALADPFGIAAVDLVTKYWTASERNTRLPPLPGDVLTNRAIWFGVAFALLGLAWFAFRRERRPSRRERRRTAAAAAAQAAAERTTHLASTPAAGAPAPRASGWAQLVALTRFDMRSAFRSPAYIVLLGIGFINAIGGLWYADDYYGTKVHPVTRLMIETLAGSFTIIPLIIAIYYAGELVWRDRERRMHEIVDATPAPDWTFVVPKILAISLVLLTTIVISVAAAICVQALKGHMHFELAKYLGWYVAPWVVDVVLYAVLAVFIQTLVPHKFVGLLVMLVFLVAQMTLARIGFEHNLYQYAGSPSVPLSDMNGQGDFARYAAWFRAYWSAGAVILAVLAYALWRRGVSAPLAARLKLLPRRLASPAGALAAFAAVAMAVLGGYIFYNTNVLNEYRPREDNERWAADYEKTLLGFERVPQPRITDVTLDVALYPHEPRAVITGHYAIENRTGAPLDQVHVRWPRLLEMRHLEVDGAHVTREFADLHSRIYTFDTPLAPGERRELRFETVREQVGFRNSGNEQRIVDNGTFVDSTEIAPGLGVSRDPLLKDRAKRRKYGLPAERRPPKLEDESARAFQYIGHDSDWVNADITVSTVADQVAVAPGYLIDTRVEGGRRIAHYRTDAPILGFFSIQSAAYAIRKDQWNDVALAVYYDPAHAYNVDRMIDAMKASLGYCSANFSPFQFRQLRILEFPAYADFAQSFANTIPYSEGIGFIVDTSDPEKIDMVTYVTAHEVGHQWWAHQVIGADMQGMTMLSETLAQYSALMVMEKMYGPEHIRKFLKFELDRYLSSRGGEVIEELPLDRVEDQPYIHYRKGSLAMYLLKDQIGEEAVNRALRSLLAAYAFKGPPYPRSLDLVERLRAETGPEHQQLITDLFEKITLYDVKVTSARAKKRGDGKYDVTLEVDARKMYADGKGVETETPLDESFDVGVFTAEPGDKDFTRASVLSMGRQQVRTGKQTLTVIVDKEPKFAGVDPYNKYVDRNADDNVQKEQED
jgi:aminopeptidase N